MKDRATSKRRSTDAMCSSSASTIPTAAITTNTAGNGDAYHVFTPADADGLRGLTVGGRWMLLKGDTPAYLKNEDPSSGHRARSAPWREPG
jgi:hypothetical protein